MVNVPTSEVDRIAGHFESLLSFSQRGMDSLIEPQGTLVRENLERLSENERRHAIMKIRLIAATDDEHGAAACLAAGVPMPETADTVDKILGGVAAELLAEFTASTGPERDDVLNTLFDQLATMSSITRERYRTLLRQQRVRVKHFDEEIAARLDGHERTDGKTKTAAVKIELLDALPPVIRRPLALVDGRAYAAAWLPCQFTRSESVNRAGDVVKHDPPIVENTVVLCILRGDGVMFGVGGDKPLDEMGVDITLTETPEAKKTMTTRAVQAYRKGEWPDPVDVLRRVAGVVDQFIDFNRSLTDQATMSETMACYTMASYMLPAFDVVGFLWPNGDRGSGKTKLLTTIAEMAYLGEVILAGGSYAALRDLADYGAVIAFDDAENFSDARRSDPDKRALLLAGNRAGNTIPLKELDGDQWKTRRVSTFCPRMFSAIKLPDEVLGSRAIVVPLIRTADRGKANSEPLDHETWPTDRRQLIDDLWAVALAHLPKLRNCQKSASADARIMGRTLEPWRGILAVARWLDEMDTDGELQREYKKRTPEDGKKVDAVGGLYDRLEELSYCYQDERADLEYGDLPVVVARALLTRCANHANLANCANLQEGTPEIYITSSELVEIIHGLIANDESSLKEEFVTSQRVGMRLRAMRLKKPLRPGGQGPRQWAVTLGDMEHWSTVYGLAMPEKIQEIQKHILKNDASRSPVVGIVGMVGMVGMENDDENKTDAVPTGDEIDAGFGEVLAFE